MDFVLTHLLGLVVIKKGSILHNPLTDTEKTSGLLVPTNLIFENSQPKVPGSLILPGKQVTISYVHYELWKRTENSQIIHHLLGIISPENRLNKTTGRKVLQLIKEINHLNIVSLLI